MESTVKKTPAGILKCAPKWVDVLPLFLQTLAESKDPKALDMAHAELRRMASLADQLNELVNPPEEIG
jgi:hypothetical protein